MALKEAIGRAHIDMPRDEVWQRLRDISVAHNYVPGVAAIRVDTAKREGVGASRTVIMDNGRTMQETVEEWTDGHGFLIRLHNGDKVAMPIFRQFYFRYRIDDDGEGTLLSPAMLYETRFGPIGALMGKAIHKAFGKAVQDIALAMRDYYLTGQRVTPDRLKEIRQADAQNS